MAPRLTVVEELKDLARFVAASKRARYLELLQLLAGEAEEQAKNHPVRAHWAKYRASQEFTLTYPDGKTMSIYGLHETAQHLGLAVATFRQRMSNGKGSFHTRNGVLVERV